MSDKRASQAISGITKIEAGNGGLERMTVTNALGEAHVYLHGATVTHFAPKGQAPVLWLSERSVFAPGKGIRGGIPVCWPWFANHPVEAKWPAHGILRSRPWQVESAAQLADGRTRLEFVCASNDDTRAIWRHDFTARLTVTVGTALEVDFSATNTGRDPFLVEEALHTYLAVADVRKVRVAGLENGVYLDKTAGGMRRLLDADLKVTQEVDAVFALDRRTVRVVDEAGGRTIVVEKEGSESTVCWNPWVQKSVAMADMGEGAYLGVICVESGNCHDGRYSLLPGATHRLVTRLRLE